MNCRKYISCVFVFWIYIKLALRKMSIFIGFLLFLIWYLRFRHKMLSNLLSDYLVTLCAVFPVKFSTHPCDSITAQCSFLPAIPIETVPLTLFPFNLNDIISRIVKCSIKYRRVLMQHELFVSLHICMCQN